MAKVQHFIPQINNKFLCNKGDLHAEEALNLVCLDPLCRNDPLGCSICFCNVHKYHRVISVDKFVDDYARNVKQVNGRKTMKKIEKHHQTVKDLIDKLRTRMNSELDNFQESIDQYAQQLRSKTNMRMFLSQQMGIPLEPTEVKQSKSNQSFKQFLTFVLNNSLFDKSNNMINIADALKQDEQKIFVLLDKMVNMTEMCQQYIKEVMKSFSFSDDTLKEQKVIQKKHLQDLKNTKNQFDLEQFSSKQFLNKTMANSIELKKSHWHQQLYNIQEKMNHNQNQSEQIKFTFSSKAKHQMIDLKNKATVGVSNITALKPQYALLTPHLNTKPNEVKEWAVKIHKCRNFASQNTLAIGVATQSDLQNKNYQGRYPKNAVMLTSQGYVLENQTSRKTNVIFGSGDVLSCRYDPFYRLLQISKENGRKVSLKVPESLEDELHICVRLTYASDQVQIL